MPDHVARKYARLSEAYDRRWSFYVEATVRETLARLRVRPGDRVLDIGCGTGTLLSHLSAAHPAARLTGADPVPEMLAIARSKLPPDVELCHGWAERLPFPPEQFDTVVSCNMFHYVRRPMFALREIRRILRPGGQLVITDWCGDYLSCRMLDLYSRLVGRTHFKVYRAHECIRLAEQTGYGLAAFDRYKISWFWGIMTLRFAITASWPHSRERPSCSNSSQDSSASQAAPPGGYGAGS